MPRKSVAGFLLAVFFVFTVVGFANDILDMGREPKIRFALVVLLSGLFAVAYASSGIRLRQRFWMAVPPIYAVQYLVNGWIASRFPDGPQLAQTTEMQRLQGRLTFDAVATIIAVSLGYACFVFVSIREGKRYGKTREEMAVLESEVTAAREVQEVIVPSPGDSYPGFIVRKSFTSRHGRLAATFFRSCPRRKAACLSYSVTLRAKACRQRCRLRCWSA